MALPNLALPPGSTRPNLLSAPIQGSGFGEFFRYHGWLAPGVRLFRSITFTAKAAWVSAAFVIPLLITLLFMVGEINEQIKSAKHERAGVAYVRPVLDLIDAAQARRLAAVSNAPDLPVHQDKVRSAFDAVQARQSELGSTLSLDKPFAQLKRSHAALVLTVAAGQPDDTFKAHMDHIHDALMLLREVSDGSQLTLDPDLDTFHLMNVAVLRGPREAENTARIRALGMMALSSKELSTQRRDWINNWIAVQAYLDEDVENSYQAVIGITPEVERMVDMKGTDEAGKAFMNIVRQQLLGPQPSGDANEFGALGSAAVEAQSRMNRKLLDRLDAQLQVRIGRLQAHLYLQLAVSLAFVALAGYLMLSFYRVMMGGLREVSGHLEEITKGNLTTCPRPWGRDEAAQLMTTMGAMQTSLRRIVRIVLQSSVQVHTASEEIAAASHDLSGRTEQTAANLEETSSSMEQISSTVKQTADAVDGAMTIVRDNAAAATRGGEVISQVVATMEGIHASSKKIGEIIGVIDSIAFQTNILALNAAVEAARAGEQGRGFAVVATEVRALAGRSATAAKEIKTLITSSLEQVANGNRIAAQAGATVMEIVTNADKITGLMNEISTATREQSLGVGQVGSAVQELDQSTQQNAALVEQTSAAAASLSEQAERLAREVSFFRLP
jgi:methyl-accepting chemotaxis protein